MIGSIAHTIIKINLTPEYVIKLSLMKFLENQISIKLVAYLSKENTYYKTCEAMCVSDTFEKLQNDFFY